MLVFALDIGGSSVKHALIECDGRVGEILEAGTPVPLTTRTFDEVRETVLRLVVDVDDRTSHVAICTTGSVDAHGIVLNAGHFTGYTNIDWQALIKSSNSRVGSVHVLNDGRASTWAEFIGQDSSDSIVHFVVGTGIGGGLVSKGDLITGEHGLAGYLGHLKVDLSGSIVCSCGTYGCIETVAAAPAILRHYASATGRDDLVFSNVIEAAGNGDELAVSAFRSAGEWLGLAVSHVMNILDPGVVTIGGGVAQISQEIAGPGLAGPYIDAAFDSALRRAHRRVAAKTLIRMAKYGNNGGLLGAAFFAYDRLGMA